MGEYNDKQPEKHWKPQEPQHPLLNLSLDIVRDSLVEAQNLFFQKKGLCGNRF